MSALAQGLGVIGSSLWQHELNKSDRDESREYMSPKNQMSRLIEGGVNPARSLSQGVVFDNQGQDIAPTDISSSMSSVSGVAGVLQQQQLLDAQKDVLESEAEKNRSQSGLNNVQAFAQKLQNDFLPQILDLDVKGKSLENLLKDSTIGLNRETANKVKEETNKLKVEQDAVRKQLSIFDEELKKVRSEAEMAEIRAKLTPDLVRAELNKINSSISADNAAVQQLHALAQQALSSKNLTDLEYEVNKATKDYVTRKAASESRLALNKEMMSENELATQQAGQVVSETMAPAREFMSAVGSLFGSFKNIIK